MNKKNFSFLISIIIFTILSGCQDVKKGLSGKKIDEGNEFLVIKKNPLVLPPDFNMLPEPKDSVELSREESIEAEIDDILSSIKSNEILNEEIETETGGSSTEDFVLDQIKN